MGKADAVWVGCVDVGCAVLLCLQAPCATRRQCGRRSHSSNVEGSLTSAGHPQPPPLSPFTLPPTLTPDLGLCSSSLCVPQVVEESQLLFRVEPRLGAGVVSSMAAASPLLSLDCVCLVDNDHFLTGGDDGAVVLWSTQKKRPIHLVPAAHGADHWLISVAIAPHADVAFTGSSDGHINCYELTSPQQQRATRREEGTGPTAASPASASASLASASLPPGPAASGGAAPLRLVRRVPLVGYVNSLSAAHSGRFLVAGVGQEHRAGRWTERIAAAKNGIAILPLLPHSQQHT